MPIDFADFSHVIEQRQISKCNIGVFATEDIPIGSVLIKERPFYKSNMEQNVKFLKSNEPTNCPKTNAEVKALRHKIEMMNKEWIMTKHAKISSSKSKCHPETLTLVERQNEILWRHLFSTLPEETRIKWMSLHDARQDIPINGKTDVGICDLTSAKGAKLNGKVGLSKTYVQKSKRYAVQVQNDSGESEDLLLKRENLKTPAGVLRTNGFENGLFERRSRLNHSCIPNTQWASVSDWLNILNLDNTKDFAILDSEDPDNEVVVVSCQIIKRGEEVICSYINGVVGMTTAERREKLYKKWRFNCECEACINDVTISRSDIDPGAGG